MRNFAASVRPEEDGRRVGKEMLLLQEKWMILYGPPVEWLIIGKCNFPMASPVRRVGLLVSPSVCHNCLYGREVTLPFFNRSTFYF